MKALFNKFLKEHEIKPDGKVSEVELRELTKKFSAWLSGYKDTLKNKKRFESTYRVNKFMVRKYLEKLSIFTEGINKNTYDTNARTNN